METRMEVEEGGLRRVVANGSDIVDFRMVDDVQMERDRVGMHLNPLPVERFRIQIGFRLGLWFGLSKFEVCWVS